MNQESEIAGVPDRIETETAEPQLKTLLVSDLVESTKLVERVGDARSADIFGRHDRLARDLLEERGGLEIDKSDGFLLLFDRPLDAVQYALAYHEGLRALSQELEVELRSRVGIHLGDAYLRENPPEDVARGAKPLEVEGLAKPTAARLMTVALGGQTLLTRTAFDLARREAVGVQERLQWLAHGQYQCEGIDEPLDVFEVGITGVSPLVPPPDAKKVRRLTGDEEVLGWRPAPGKTILRHENWVIESKLGEGGFGEVWLAKHNKTGEQRVFKFCVDAAHVRSLRREANLFRVLKAELGSRHDIARVIDWSLTEPPFLLQSEYTEGGSLPDWIEAQGGFEQVPLATRLELVAQAAEALAAAHSVGVLHKDVKPQNILISQDHEGSPRVQLADFGIGRVLDEQVLAEMTEQLGMTEHSELLGSRLYLAPELQEGRESSVKGDIYALGVVLYQMVVGDLTCALGQGWDADVEDDLLADDIWACVFGKTRRRLDDASQLAKRLRTLEERRRQQADEHKLRDEIARSRRRWKVAITVIAALILVAGALGFHSWRVAQEAKRTEQEAQTANEVARFMVELFGTANPNESRGSTITVREMLDKGAERIHRELEGTPLIQARIMNTMAEAYLGLGLYDPAVTLSEKALRLRKEIHGDEHPDVAESIHILAILLETKCDYENAEPLHREALAMKRRLYGDEHLEVAVSINNLAKLLKTKGDYENAEPLYRESLAMKRRLYGDEHLRVAIGINNLAVLLKTKGDYENAEPLYRESLAMKRRLYGDEHPSVAIGINNLAVLLKTKGDYENAAPLYREALTIKRRMYGDEHPSVAFGIYNLAMLLREMGDIEGAEPLLKEALAMRRRMFGEDHTDVAESINSVATVLFDKGDIEGAEPLLHEALAMKRRLFGEDHPGVALVINNLATLLQAKGDYEIAESLLKEALAIRRRLFGEDHTDVAESINNLAMLLFDKGDVEGAEPLLHEALEIRRRLFGEDHPGVALVINNLAMLLKDKGNYAEAEEAIREALSIFRSSLQADHWRIANAESVLGACLAASGHYAEAEDLLLASYPLVSQQRGETSRYTRDLLERIVTLYEAWGRPKQAAEYRTLLEAAQTPTPSGGEQ